MSDRDLMDCEIRAMLAGFRSDIVSLAGHRIMDRPDIGTIVLYRIANVEGFTISGTTASAPKEARDSYDKGITDAKKRKFDQAEKELRKAVDIDPKYAVAWYALGRLMEMRQRPEDAEGAYKFAIEADARYIWPYDRLAMLAVSEQKWPDVAGNTERIIHLNPYDFPSAYYYNAMANLELGQLDAAEKSGREALKMDPQHGPKMGYLLGLVLAQKHVFGESAELLRGFLNTLPKGPDADIVQKQLNTVENLAQTPPPSAQDTRKHPAAMGFH
jgi:tetratricopeptide (TPR) repeat protein